MRQGSDETNGGLTLQEENSADLNHFDQNTDQKYTTGSNAKNNRALAVS